MIRRGYADADSLLRVEKVEDFRYRRQAPQVDEHDPGRHPAEFITRRLLGSFLPVGFLTSGITLVKRFDDATYIPLVAENGVLAVEVVHLADFLPLRRKNRSFFLTSVQNQLYLSHQTLVRRHLGLLGRVILLD
jgi:hypothetical protein